MKIKEFLSNSILFRNSDVTLGLLVAVGIIVLLRDESHGLNGILYQFLAAMLIIAATVSVGSYTQRKVFPYFRPDKYLPEGAKDMKNISVDMSSFKQAMICGVFRLVWMLGVMALMGFMMHSLV